MAQVSTPPAIGDGSAGNPYQIATLNNLYWITQNSAEWSKRYIQTSDIDATSSSGWNSGQGFNPIGTTVTQFTGTYNGQDHTITGLHINRPATNDQGMFGVVRAATFNNMRFVNVNVVGNDHVGTLYARSITTACPVSNCRVSGYVDGHANVGGLVGNATSPSGAISNCTSTATMFGWRFIGGIAGLIGGITGQITGCYYEGTMTYEQIQFGGAVMGGIVGQTTASMNRCCAVVNMTGVESLGGIAGVMSGGANNTDGHITECSSSGTISGSFGVGGIVGGNFGSNDGTRNLRDCHSSVAITIVGTGFEIGGILGFNRDNVDNCYFSGTITGATSRHKGGVVGRNFNGTVSKCIYNSTLNPGFVPVGTGPGGDTGSNTNNYGKTTTEMKQQSTYQTGGLSWNFTTIWDIDNGNDYPFLRNSACQTACADADSDAICDEEDNCVNNANANQADADGDGVGDACDNCPNDPDKTAPGICGCGVADTDTDGDGTLDCNDGCPNDPNKTAPGICGCGVSDADTDNDGTADCNDGCPNDPNKTAPGICGCGVADTDTDNDGTADCNDGCPNDPNKTAPGQCGCGVADTDTDNDGTADCNDGCPNDPNKTAPGNCGCGSSDTGPLTVTCPASVPVISTNSSCQGAIPDYTALARVSGTGCATSTVVQTPPQGTIVNPGTVTIKLTVTDSNSGDTANCMFNVTVSGGCGN
ncbi:MAG: thrombospondin type 3 repeat-containing protein [Saprospiraceae bacterium]